MIATQTQPRPAASAELIRLAQQGSAAEYSQALKETGTAILSSALEVFSKMDRELEDGRSSIEQLRDLKNSLIAHIDRNQKCTQSNQDQLDQEVAAMNSGQHPTVKLAEKKTENLTNATSILEKGRPAYAHLLRETEAQKANLSAPKIDSMAGAKKFLADLTAVQGLYTAAVLVPGPLSLSMKNVVKESYASQSQSNGQITGQSESAGIGASLLALGGGASHSQSNISGAVSSKNSTNYEKSTLDERVIPVLSELQDRLSQATAVPATLASIELKNHISEYEGSWGLFGRRYNRVASTYGYAHHPITTTVESREFQPEHVRLPETSISDYTK